MKIELTDKAQKQLSKLPISEANKVYRKLKILENNPFNGKKLEGRLQNEYSFRAWPYRILYFINNERNTIQVDTIEHRQSVYRH